MIGETAKYCIWKSCSQVIQNLRQTALTVFEKVCCMQMKERIDINHSMGSCCTNYYILTEYSIYLLEKCYFSILSEVVARSSKACLAQNVDLHWSGCVVNQTCYSVTKVSASECSQIDLKMFKTAVLP